MGYNGHASKGCLDCRARRKRCSQQVPECSECLSRGIQCRGYRPPDDLFRDQTVEVVQKVQRKHRIRNSAAAVVETQLLCSSTSGAASTPTAHPTSSGYESAAGKELSLSPPLQIILEDAAVNFFGRNYGDGHQGFRSLLDYVLPIYQHELLSSNHLIGSALKEPIVAHGLLLLAREKKDQQCLLLSRKRYGMALKRTNELLQDPDLAKLDDTFLAVQLLAYYEMTTWSKAESMRSWEAHLNGAVSLLRIRGLDQLRTSLGTLLFNVTVMQSISSGYVRREPIHKIVLNLISEALPLVGDEECAFCELARKVNSFLVVRSAIKHGKLQVAEKIVSACLIENAQLRDWATNLPSSYNVVEVPSTPSEDVYSTYYHVHDGMLPALAWNIWQVARSISLKTARNQLISCDERVYDPRLVTVESELLELALGICASIPQHRGNLHSSWYLWSWWVAATSGGAPASMKRWIKLQLKHVEERTGSDQAKAVAMVLESGADASEWMM